MGAAGGAGAVGAAVLGGGRYRITSGIARAAHGNVYRALDRDTGQPVVVKQARAHVAEDEFGRDARHRLRHERRVLQVLEGVEGVPRLVDYFGYGADEFLVTDDCGGRNLRRDVVLGGPHRDPLRLADELGAILSRIHERGVVVRDVKPDNVVLDASGHCHLVDFGISAVDGVGPTGTTPGYSPAGSGDADGDRYALGVTLGFAATGLDPVVIDESAAVNRDRSLAVLEASGVDPEVSKRIRALMKAPAITRLPPVPDDDLLDEIIGHTVAFCVAAAGEMMRESSAPIDVYAGSSGLGLELVHHAALPGVSETVDRLARWTARQQRDLSAGLYTGRTGVALFLQQAGLPYDDTDLRPRDRLDGRPPEADLIEGAAGIGLGHLLLAAGAGSAAGGCTCGAPGDHHLKLAAACQSLLTSGAATLTPTDVTKPGNAALAEGLAHGDAGVALFLVEYAQATGCPEALFAARAACDRLAALTLDLVSWARRSDASRRYASWCRGLAGIGMVLIRAADRISAPEYLCVAERCADACLGIAPRMPHVIQCCGLAGVGDFLVDAALALREDRWWHEARGVARLMLARSAGTWSRPDFPDVELTRSGAGWASGSTGVLGFLRRLRDRGGPRPALEL